MLWIKECDNFPNRFQDWTNSLVKFNFHPDLKLVDDKRARLSQLMVVIIGDHSDISWLKDELIEIAFGVVRFLVVFVFDTYLYLLITDNQMCCILNVWNLCCWFLHWLAQDVFLVTSIYATNLIRVDSIKYCIKMAFSNHNLTPPPGQPPSPCPGPLHGYLRVYLYNWWNSPGNLYPSQCRVTE